MGSTGYRFFHIYFDNEKDYMNKKIGNFELSEFVLIVIIAVSIWWVPQWIFDIKGAFISGLLSVMGFALGWIIVILIRKIKRNKK